MASKAFIDTKLNALPSDIRLPLRDAFYYLMDNWRVGTDRRAQNAQWYRLTSTTASVANTEFSIAHGLGTTPSQVLQILDLSAINGQMVPLTVSKAADADRIYLKSSSTSAVLTLLVET